jgi:hypothetical protein
VEAYQLIGRVYVKALHERTDDMRAAICTCITHARTSARVSRFTRYYHVTCDLRRCTIASWHGVFNEQFISVVHFLLVNSTTPKLPRQPRLAAHREVPGGGS